MSIRQRALTAARQPGTAGYWRVIAHPPRAEPVDVTWFRGSPVTIGDFAFTDPFGPLSMTLVFPQVTIFDARGVGDLSWMRRNVNVDVLWDGDLPPSYPFGLTQTVMAAQHGPVPASWPPGHHWTPPPPRTIWQPMWRWEGFISSFADATGGCTVQLKGAGLQLDNFLAKPEYVSRPLPYEWAIARQFLNKPSLRINPLKIVWPNWWTKRYTAPPKTTPSYLIPAGVTPGKSWTGLTTRSTGSWDPVLSSYIQTLLASMYTERGRWTLDLAAGRQPVMMHRDFLTAPNASTVIIDPTLPSTVINLTEDGEAALTTVYGQTNSLSGVTYSGMDISADGESTDYLPLAASRQVYPALSNNGWFDDQVMEKEAMVQMQTGLSADDASIVARAHLSRFADPGVTGTVTIGSDPMMGGVPLPRALVRAGMEAHLPGIYGRPEGLLVHISSSVSSIATGTTTLTVDSKFRDALTVEEVRLRGRDALSVSRMLIGGQFAPLIPDGMFPWSYEQGSGYIPSNPVHSSVKLFSGMPREVSFPWQDWTRRRPPKDSKWRSCYIRIGPTRPNADQNWATQHSVWGSEVGIPIKMAAAGTVRLLQLAAYDKNGAVMKVPFHVSFYTIGSVNPKSTPAIPANQVHLFPPYAAAQHYPFVVDGWETYHPDGSLVDPNVPQPTQTVGLLRAYGTSYQRAGYFPGDSNQGDAPTGLLVDETQWTFDLTKVADGLFDPYHAEKNLTNKKAGLIYMLIYCDAQGADEVFFTGRLFRSEIGSTV